MRDARLINLHGDPVELLRRCSRRMVLLHSGRSHQRWARQSILAEPAAWYRFHATPNGGRGSWQSEEDSRQVLPPFLPAHNPFEDLRRITLQLEGMWIGYISYDIARWIERLPTLANDDRGWPIMEMAWCPRWLSYDTIDQHWHAHGQWDSDPAKLFDEVVTTPHLEASELTTTMSRDRYQDVVQRGIDYIAAGDVFQVNLAQRLTASLNLHESRSDAGRYLARSLFQRLNTVSPAWYGAMLELPGGRALVSASPELFLEVDGGHVITRPIKGTRPASREATELRDSAKDEAELNMIVDLLRNDLGRVCTYGSMHVSSKREIESHPTVHHGVATIEGDLHPSKDIVSLLRAALPGGSITGAPKVRAMQIIEELEPVRRGPYCGCMGWLTRDACCLNIAIRTMALSPQRQGAGSVVDYAVGAGIVAESHPANEYQETLDKAAPFFAAIGSDREAVTSTKRTQACQRHSIPS